MNERNLKYIRPHNSRRAIRLADDKLASKRLLKQTGIKAPRFYGVIADVKDFEQFDWDKLPRSFVLKPNLGFGGGGIVILRSKLKKKQFSRTSLKRREWTKSDGSIITFDDLKAHVLDIIDGTFSLSGVPDIALFERKIVRHVAFRGMSRRGVPDIRLIVYNKVPVMAMLRLPTERSKGRANLFQGAIGVGVDAATGVTTHAIIKAPYRQIIEKHPDSKKDLVGFQIPFWDEILTMSIEAQIATNIGFLGIDIAIDNKYGPEVLELNARPGLEIQVANLEGLGKRLERVDGLKIQTVDKGVNVAKELFGGDIARRVEEVSGKKVLGTAERVKVLNKKGTRKFPVEAKIDTGADSTSISVELAKKLGYKDLVKAMDNRQLDLSLSDKEALRAAKKAKQELKKEYKDLVDVTFIRSGNGLTLRPCVNLTFYISGEKRIAMVNMTEREGLKYSMIVGKNDLKNFLVDPQTGK